MSTWDPERWRAAIRELDAVTELTTEARAVHLESLRTRDAALAADVERLLEERGAVQAEGFLNAPVADVDETREATYSDTPAASPASPRALVPGTVLGPYRIVQILGRGGMGTVYQADEIDSGRRVALKVLEERLHDARERERFHREGRLAASLNHPHCVFVFAAAEIDGRLVIAMELMAGTLADRLKASGPLPPAEAVDYVLQLLAGLQAAAALGILHRDVKPSNCFIDGSGTVKIGDFGISRSLRPTEETAFSTRTKFAATPAYASPEQLRGATLDVRADIYSLGATLYELLTGRRPFERDDLMAMLMAVANDPPQPPHLIVHSVPKDLSHIVLRCLAKQPEQRFADYDALAAALEPYSSTAATPATFGRRFVAGVLDHVALTFLNMPITLWWTNLPAFDHATFIRQLLVWQSLLLLYFAISETVWRATPGKAVVGLTLVDRSARPPRPWRTLARALIYCAAWSSSNLLWIVFGPSDSKQMIDTFSQPSSAFLIGAVQWIAVAALFSSARRRNGYAGWHDLVTGTRVVERRAVAQGRRTSLRIEPVLAEQTTCGVLGPFTVIDARLPAMPEGWRPGIDERLQRLVWIRTVDPGTPPLDTARVEIGRTTRLRWIAGRRQPTENWDAFEAIQGVPLADACQRPRTWADARWWLRDLARECAAQSSTDRPPLRADRIWVLDGGGAKLVDDPAIDRASTVTSTSPSACAPLLLDVIRSARRGAASPWPLGAHRFIEQLLRDPAPDSATIVSALESLVRQRAVLTHGWRALSIAAVAVPPVLFAVLMAMLMGTVVAQVSRIPREVWEASEALTQLRKEDEGKGVLPPDTREALEIALATRYRHVLTDPRINSPQFFMLGLVQKEVIERVLRRSPTDSEGQRASEHPAVQALAKDARRNTERPPPPASTIALALLVGLLTVIAFCALLSSIAFRGGLLRLLGLEVVTADGRPASRIRVLARTALAWSPLILLVVVSTSRGALGIRIADTSVLLIAFSLTLLAMLAGAVVATLHPEHGIQDRLAGTWIVPR